MLALHLLQSALVLVSTRLVDGVLDSPTWQQLTETNLRELTPLFWSNAALHGTFELDLNQSQGETRMPAIWKVCGSRRGFGLDTRLDYDAGADPAA